MTDAYKLIETLYPYYNGNKTYNINSKELNKIINDYKKTPLIFSEWFNSERINILNTYFSDFDTLKDCHETDKINYYIKLGIKPPKIIGQPKLELLVKLKAKKIWLDIKDKLACHNVDNDDNDDNVDNDDNDDNDDNEIDDNLLSESDSDNDNNDNDSDNDNNNNNNKNIIKVREYWYNENIYYLDIENNDIYKNIINPEEFNISNRIAYLNNGVFTFYK